MESTGYDTPPGNHSGGFRSHHPTYSTDLISKPFYPAPPSGARFDLRHCSEERNVPCEKACAK